MIPNHVWFQADHSLGHIWSQADHSKIIVWFFVWFVWYHIWSRLWSAWAGNPGCMILILVFGDFDLTISCVNCNFIMHGIPKLVICWLCNTLVSVPTWRYFVDSKIYFVPVPQSIFTYLVFLTYAISSYIRRRWKHLHHLLVSKDNEQED